MENTFLAINKDYFKMGLKILDVAIIAQVEEFQRNKCACYITNEQFSEMFGESIDKVKRSLTKLEQLGIIKRNTSFVEGNGRGNRQRVLSINDKAQWKVHNAPTIMEGAKSDNGRCKSEEWKVHNAPIKDNKKDNKKDNIKEKEFLLGLFDDATQEEVGLGLVSLGELLSDEVCGFMREELEYWGADLSFTLDKGVVASLDSEGIICGEYHL